MKLSEYAKGRDNNFNLIRMIAAMLVLAWHSTTLSGNLYNPLHHLGIGLAAIAVDTFFITSGFLVSASLIKRQNALEFLIARILRIYPALLAMLLITVFGLGLFFTTETWQSYLSDKKTYYYLAKGVTLVTGVAYKLPGVFESNPFPGGVNGSLWTLPLEIRMYGILLGLFVVTTLFASNRVKLVSLAVILIAVGAFGAHLFSLAETGKLLKATQLTYMFFAGASFYVLKDRINLSHLLGLVLIALVLASAVNKYLFHLVYALALPYVVLYLAYLPGGFIRSYNKLGDYSYGVYIYAFPIQQAVAASISKISIMQMFWISAAITLVFAVLSWHLIEKPALAYKDRVHGFLVNRK